MRADWSRIALKCLPSSLGCFLKMVVNSSPTARLDEPSDIHKEQPESVQTCAYVLHPPNPAPLFPPTRPTDCFAIDYPGRALCPGEHRLYINGPSKLSLLPSRNGTHVVPTAPVEGAPPLISQFDWSRVRAPGAQERYACRALLPGVCVRRALETNRLLRPSFGLPLREHRSDRRVLPPIPFQTLAEPSRPKAQ
jgi:hypothetical protein